jgi:Glycoside hydrolase family 5 C-terminal domain/Cellulase (glycosyl hydrolase family 5)
VLGGRFVDDAGRELLLRGVNLGGDCKVPWPDGGTHHYSNFADHREVSFIGRPFPLDEAEEHFGRLRHWGFNCIRLLTTWEAVEHAGPGLYDEAYLDYFAQLCRLAGAHGLYVFVDFHQDAWSRMSGGSGAPGWTFAAVGLDFTKFGAAGAAHVMQSVYDYSAPQARQAAYPQMTWGINYRLPANAVMWTLFWGGRWITPDFCVDGINAQDYLQRHYLGAMSRVARSISSLVNVLGFDTLNEPGAGWIGERLTYRHVGPSEENPVRARPGPALTALDALAIARGIPTRVPTLVLDPARGKVVSHGETLLNPHGISIWQPAAACPFEKAGAYEVRGGAVHCLNDQIFRGASGRVRTMIEDSLGPFFHAVASTVRAHQPCWSVFAEMDPWGVRAGRTFPLHMPAQTVNANHWYDASILFSKRFDPHDSPDWVSGIAATSAAEIRERYVRELTFVAALGQTINGGAPSLIGEFGIPFDLNEGGAYRDWAHGRKDQDIWADHVTALSLMYDALDELRLHATLWNYTASNRNDLRIGDGWNQEDLSIFSRDQQDDPASPDSGGRAIGGFCRPFVRFLQGRLRSLQFLPQEGSFTLEFDADPAIRLPTEIYLPAWHFPHGYELTIDANVQEVARSAATQTLTVRSARQGVARVRVLRAQRGQ